jgi:hypothetical protein
LVRRNYLLGGMEALFIKGGEQRAERSRDKEVRILKK